MNTRIFNCVWVLGLFLAGCVAMSNVPKPVETGLGTAAISIELCPSSSIFPCRKAEQLVFIAVGEDNNVLHPTQIFRSTWTSGVRGFLFNRKPGIYGVVAASFSTARPQTYGASMATAHNRTMSHMVYFPEEMVRKTLTEVKSGTLEFLGIYQVVFEMMSKLDPVQGAYYNLLENSGAIEWVEVDPLIGIGLWVIKGEPQTMMEGGTGVGKQMLRGFLQGRYSHQGRLKKSDYEKEQEIDFWQAAQDELTPFGWGPIIQDKINKVQQR